MTAVMLCPNCGATHRSDTQVDESLVMAAAASVDVDGLWDEFMDPAAGVLEAAAQALAPKPRRRRRSGVPAAARVSAPAVSAVPTKTFQVLMGNGERKLYQAPDKETAERIHKASHPRDKTQQVVEIRR